MQDRYQCPDCFKPLFEDSVHRCLAQAMRHKLDTYGLAGRSEKSLTFQINDRLEKLDKSTKPLITF